MNYARKYQREDSNNLLKAMLEAGGLLTLVFVLPGAAPALVKAFYEYREVKAEKLRKTIYRLNKSGLISITERTDGQITLRLEDKGKQKVIKRSIEEMQIKKPEKWDGLWRIVAFDIPDEFRYARHIFQEQIVSLRFVEIQKSIYAHPYPCEEEIEMLRSLYRIKPYVRLIHAKSIEHDAKLLSRFGLSRSETFQ